MAILRSVKTLDWFDFLIFLPKSHCCLFTYRKCNCDAAELQWRRDGGVINSTSKLPVKTLNFMDSQRDGAQGIITLGKLYCAQVDFGMIEGIFSTMNTCTLILNWRKFGFSITSISFYMHSFHMHFILSFSFWQFIFIGFRKQIDMLLW